MTKGEFLKGFAHTMKNLKHCPSEAPNRPKARGLFGVNW